MPPSKSVENAKGQRKSTPQLPWQAFWEYSTDFWQRNVLFADVMRQRGNQHLEHMAQPVQHVLRYQFEKVMDGRELQRPVNYGLVRILPPEGIELDDNKRPLRRRRPASRPWSRDRWVQGRQPGWRHPEGRPSLLLHRLSVRSRSRPDD